MSDMKHEVRVHVNPAFDVPDDTPLCDAFLLAEYGKHESDITAPCDFKALDKNTLRITWTHKYYNEYDGKTYPKDYECLITLPTALGGVGTVIYHDDTEDDGMTKTAYVKIPFGNVLECAFESIWNLFHAVLSHEHRHVRENLKLYPFNKKEELKGLPRIKTDPFDAEQNAADEREAESLG